MRKSNTILQATVSKNKVALIDHIRGVERINLQLEKENNETMKRKLLLNKKSHIKAINSLIPFLNSVGKLSDYETKKLLSLDFMNMKSFRAQFRIGGL